MIVLAQLAQQFTSYNLSFYEKRGIPLEMLLVVPASFDLAVPEMGQGAEGLGGLQTPDTWATCPAC